MSGCRWERVIAIEVPLPYWTLLLDGEYLPHECHDPESPSFCGKICIYFVTRLLLPPLTVHNSYSYCTNYLSLACLTPLSVLCHTSLDSGPTFVFLYCVRSVCCELKHMNCRTISLTCGILFSLLNIESVSCLHCRIPAIMNAIF